MSSIAHAPPLHSAANRSAFNSRRIFRLTAMRYCRPAEDLHVGSTLISVRGGRALGSAPAFNRAPRLSCASETRSFTTLRTRRSAEDRAPLATSTIQCVRDGFKQSRAFKDKQWPVPGGTMRSGQRRGRCPSAHGRGRAPPLAQDKIFNGATRQCRRLQWSCVRWPSRGLCSESCRIACATNTRQPYHPSSWLRRVRRARRPRRPWKRPPSVSTTTPAFTAPCGCHRDHVPSCPAISPTSAARSAGRAGL